MEIIYIPKQSDQDLKQYFYKLAPYPFLCAEKRDYEREPNHYCTELSSLRIFRRRCWVEVHHRLKSSICQILLGHFVLQPIEIKKVVGRDVIEVGDDKYLVNEEGLEVKEQDTEADVEPQGFSDFQPVPSKRLKIITNDDGRCPNLTSKESTSPGQYKLYFDTEQYFTGRDMTTFYPFVEIVFTIRTSEEHYHVPLLLSPFGYSTYRAQDKISGRKIGRICYYNMRNLSFGLFPYWNMARNLPKLLLRNIVCLNKCQFRYKSQRRNLGKAPGAAKSLAQRLEEMDSQDPAIYYKVNIGFAKNKLSRREVVDKRVEQMRKNRANSELELAARNNKLVIPLEEVEHDWSSTDGPEHIRTAAEHYGIYDHLFGDGYFLPVVDIDINYNFQDSEYPVYRGNHLKPEMSLLSPDVSFQSSKDSLWTLLMTTPDGHLDGGEKEYVHWLIGNIKDNDLNSGEVVFDYLQPFPARGLGYLRYIFILFKQDEPLDFSSLKENPSEFSLVSRTFSTYNFYRKRESLITPAGLAWFQADWDTTVSTFFHEKLKYNEEPVFMYDFPDPYHPKQEWFPIKKAFNLYMDRYRDEKEIAKEYLVRKLKSHTPFSPQVKGYPFPNAIPFKKNTPSWLKTEIRKRRLGQARAADYK